MTLKRISILFIISIFFIGNLNAQIKRREDLLGQNNAITTAVPFLMIAPDARAGAMGDGGVATSPDANSLHWNPSKYAFIKDDFGFSMSYTPWLQKLVPDINLMHLSGYYRIDKQQVISASLLYFSLGDINFTDENSVDLGTYKPHEFAVDAAYSRRLTDNFSMGIAGRFIYSNLTLGQSVGSSTQSTKPGSSVAADVSAFYTNEFKFGRLNFGANISNIGTKVAYSDETKFKNFIPINLRLGAAYQKDIDDYNSITFAVDINKLLVPTPPVYDRDSSNKIIYDPVTNEPIIYKGKTSDVSVVSGIFQSFNDAPNGFKEEMQELNYSVGMEYWYDKQFAIRSGYFYEHKNKGGRQFVTLGLGLKYNAFGLDFAYLIPTEKNNPLQNTLRFSLLFNFGNAKNKSK